MITLHIASLATKDPFYDLEVHATDTPKSLKSFIQEKTSYEHQMNLWFLESATGKWKSVQELGENESDLGFGSLGIEDGSIVCLETAMDVALLALAKLENNPLKALWEVLSRYQTNTEVCPIVMAIVNFPTCGLEKRWAASDGKLSVANWDLRQNWQIGGGVTSLRATWKIQQPWQIGEGATPLLLAAFARRMDVLNALIAAGADVNAATVDVKLTALHIMCQYGRLDGVQTLLDSGADITAKTSDGMSPLLIAAQHNRLDIIQYLLSKGADIDDRCTITGETALHIAVGEGSIEAIESLVECGANVGLTCQKKNFTPLHKAASMGNAEVIEVLAAFGSDVSSANSFGYTPLFVAVNFGRVDAIRTLIANGASIHERQGKSTLFHFAAYKGNLTVIELFISKGADITAVSKDGLRPYQCFEGNVARLCIDEASKSQIRTLLAPKKMTFNFKF